MRVGNRYTDDMNRNELMESLHHYMSQCRRQAAELAQYRQTRREIFKMIDQQLVYIRTEGK